MDTLFYQTNVDDFIRVQYQKIKNDIENYNSDKLLNTSAENLANYYKKQFFLNFLKLPMVSLIHKKRILLLILIEHIMTMLFIHLQMSEG